MSAAEVIPFPIVKEHDDHVFLAGRPPVGEFLGFVKSMAVDGQSVSQRHLVDVWRTANDHLRKLEKTEAGAADRPKVLPVPEELHADCRRVLSDPVFRRAFQYVPTEIAMVELDRLVVYQKHIDLAHAAKIRASLPAKPTAKEIFGLCLPIGERQNPPVRLMQTAPNNYTFISPSDDFRFLQAEVLRNEQVDIEAIGPVTGVLGIVLGYGSNLLNVLALEGRLVLGNGSHRAYALREHGVTHVPCIVQKLTRREELELVATTDLQQHPDHFLRSARPPMLKDYFDPALRMIVPVARKNRMVRVSFGIETIDVPAQ